MSNLYLQNTTTDTTMHQFEEVDSLNSLEQSVSPQKYHLLRELFTQLDPQSLGQITHNDLTLRILNRHVKFHDKQAYQTFHNYPLTKSDILILTQFLDLARSLNLSKIDLLKMTNQPNKCDYPAFADEIKDDKGISTQEDVLAKLELTNKKKQRLYDAFSQLDTEHNGKVNFYKLSRLFELSGCDWNNEEVKKLFEEVDLKDKGFITIESMLQSLKTKKGTLSIYNLLTLSKVLSQSQQTSVPQLISIENYRKRGVDEETLLDLVQSFYLLDVEGLMQINFNLLHENEQKIKPSLNQDEKEVLNSFERLQTSYISLEEFILQFQREIYGLRSATSFAQKFNNYWIRNQTEKAQKQKLNVCFFMDEDKSPLLSTLDSLNEKASGQDLDNKSMDTCSLTKQHSLLSSSDFDNNYKNDRNDTTTAILSTQDDLDNERFDTKNRKNLNMRIVKRASASEPGDGVNFEIKPSRTSSGIEKSSQSSFLPSSLESLLEDEPNSAQKTFQSISAQNETKKALYEENDGLKLENTKLKQELEARELEVSVLKEAMSKIRVELEDELVAKQSLINKLQKEREASKTQLYLIREELRETETKASDTSLKLQKMNEETNRMKKRLAEKVKEVLIQKERIDAMERKCNERNRDFEDLRMRKEVDRKAHEEDIIKLKEKLAFLTQKFTEYLTQNTTLQGEVHQKDGTMRKMEAEFKNHVKTSDEQKQKLDLRISELEDQMKTNHKTPPKREQKGTGTDIAFSPCVSKREMEDKINSMNKVNEELVEKCHCFAKETERLRNELKEDQEQEKRLFDLEKKLNETTERAQGLVDTINGSHDAGEITKVLIETLKIQHEEIKQEKGILEKNLNILNEELESLQKQNISLTSKLNKYKLEFDFMRECLNESLYKNAGSGDSLVQENFEEKHELSPKVDEGEWELDKITLEDTKEGLENLQKYVEKLGILEQRTKALDEEIEATNKKIELVTMQNTEEEHADIERKGITDIYKKVIETKQLQIVNLKKRVKEKTGSIKSNIRLLKKLEALFSQKLDELTEVSEVKEKLLIENNRLNMLVNDKVGEIDMLKRDLNRSRSLQSTPQASSRDINKAYFGIKPNVKENEKAQLMERNVLTNKQQNTGKENKSIIVEGKSNDVVMKGWEGAC